MKSGNLIKVFLIIIVASAILLANPSNESSEKDIPVNTLLSDIEKIHVTIKPDDLELRKEEKLWRMLRAAVEHRFVQAGLNIASDDFGVNGRVVSIPQLVIKVAKQNIIDPKTTLFFITTSLETSVPIKQRPERYVRVEIWSRGDTTRADTMSQAKIALYQVTSAQVDQLINSWQKLNRKQMPLDPNSNPPEKSRIQNKRKERENQKVEFAYVASKNSKIFHKSDCSSARRIKEQNLVRFETRKKALHSGRRPCKICKP